MTLPTEPIDVVAQICRRLGLHAYDVTELGVEELVERAILSETEVLPGPDSPAPDFTGLEDRRIA